MNNFIQSIIDEIKRHFSSSKIQTTKKMELFNSIDCRLSFRYYRRVCFITTNSLSISNIYFPFDFFNCYLCYFTCDIIRYI